MNQPSMPKKAVFKSIAWLVLVCFIFTNMPSRESFALAPRIVSNSAKVVAVNMLGTEGLDERERDHIETIIRKSRPSMTSINIFDEILPGGADGPLMAELRQRLGRVQAKYANNVNLNIIALKTLGIPRNRTAGQSRDFTYAYAMQSDDKKTLEVYGTRAFVNYCIAQSNEMIPAMAEIIDNACAQASGAQAAARVLLFAREGQLSPFHRFTLQQLAADSDAELLYSISRARVQANNDQSALDRYNSLLSSQAASYAKTLIPKMGGYGIPSPAQRPPSPTMKNPSQAVDDYHKRLFDKAYALSTTKPLDALDAPSNIKALYGGLLNFCNDSNVSVTSQFSDLIQLINSCKNITSSLPDLVSAVSYLARAVYEARLGMRDNVSKSRAIAVLGILSDIYISTLASANPIAQALIGAGLVPPHISSLGMIVEIAINDPDENQRKEAADALFSRILIDDSRDLILTMAFLDAAKRERFVELFAKSINYEYYDSDDICEFISKVFLKNKTSDPLLFKKIRANNEDFNRACAQILAEFIDVVHFNRDDKNKFLSDFIHKLNQKGIIKEIAAKLAPGSGERILLDYFSDITAIGQGQAMGRAFKEGQKIVSVNNKPYFIKKELKRGGHGIVYLAQDEQGRSVVVKGLNWDNVDISMAQEEQLTYFTEVKLLFFNEVGILGQLKNKVDSAVKLVDNGSEGGSPFIILEYEEGEDLESLMKDPGFSIEDAFKIADLVLSGLRWIHKYNIVHMDIKPSNVRVRVTKGRIEGVTIMDFGISGHTDLERNYPPMGSPPYTDFEAALKRKPEPRADIYSSGVLLLKMLFADLDEKSPQFAKYILAARRNSLSTLLMRSGLNLDEAAIEELSAILHKSMAEDPQVRFKTVAEFRESLRMFSTARIAESESPYPLARPMRALPAPYEVCL